MANSGNGVVYIYKGDDTGGAFGRKFTIQVNCGVGVSLAGCTGEFVFAGITKALKNLVNGVPTEVCYSHNETAKMPYGPGLGTFAVYDSAGKRRTFQDSIRVVVTKDLKLAYPGASLISVDASAFLTPATADKLGAVKVGNGLSITNGGVLSAKVTGASVSGQKLTITKDDGTEVSLTNTDTHLTESDISRMGFTKNKGVVTSVNSKDGSADNGAVTLTGADIAVDATEGAQKISAAIGEKYTKPSGGIPASDIAPGVIPSATTIATTTEAASTTATKISVGRASAVIPAVVSPDSSDVISDDGRAASAWGTKTELAKKVCKTEFGGVDVGNSQSIESEAGGILVNTYDYVLFTKRGTTSSELTPDGSPVITSKLLTGEDGKTTTDQIKTSLFSSDCIKSTSTTLKHRDCAVVAYTAGMSLTFTEMNGLRSFEVIVTGCPADGDVGIPSTGYTYRGDSSAMTTEAGDNHFTFAEYDTNKFFITRHLANEIGA